MLRSKYIQFLFVSILAVAMYGCKADGNNPGVEYAPQMYHAVSYEPLTQITEVPDGIIESRYYDVNSLPYNDYQGKSNMNMRQPVAGTVKRQYYRSLAGADSVLMIYELHKDSINLAATTLMNPLPNTENVVEQGKHLYLGFCAPCHGEKGDGKGKVGDVYGGVANYKSAAVSRLSEGHLFHVITHGKGRMWPHKSQLSPEERWMVVRYVQKLQKGEN